ncbi:GTP-binding protein lepa [Mrakia frigida]|uniref:elongation factor 4 n=1 Tax=Mrakia frigida TaxID=29902 RepID=UPI003FCC07BE
MIPQWRLSCLTLLSHSRPSPTTPSLFTPSRRSFSSSLSFLGPKSSGGSTNQSKEIRVDMAQFPPERIRNFSVIAHIDHGKSTLSDRLLELTGTIKAGDKNNQFLDKLKVERDRGITVKAQTVSMIYTKGDEKYLLNLIDTPGHVDFSYEVSRSLAACEGALLLVDCSQGIQAQTISVHGIAFDNDLYMIPVMNKVDLDTAAPAQTAQQISTTFGLEADTVLPISAKTGVGCQAVLDAIIRDIPPPSGTADMPLRGLVIDSEYDRYRGVVSLVAVREGTLKKGDKIASSHSGKKYEVLDLGILNPEETPTAFLTAGQVGYVVCNMKAASEAIVGDTFHKQHENVEPLPGFRQTKPMVYAGIFPIDSGEFLRLEESINRLLLSDRSVTVQRETSNALGQGMRLGFLGTLHLDVFRQRLEDEYNSDVIITAPSVPYKLVYTNGTETIVSNPSEFPDSIGSSIAEVYAPMMIATILVPEDYIGPMMELCASHRGIQTSYTYLDGTPSTPSTSSASPASTVVAHEGTLGKEKVSSNRAVLKYKIPMSEIVTGFFDELKSLSSGFASLDYEDAGWEKSDNVKMSLAVNGNTIDALSMIVHRSDSQVIGKAWVAKLKGILPRQQFDMNIQALLASKAVASEKITAMRKDVTAGLYGGDFNRKRKVLDKQKEGKSRLKKMAGNVEIPQEAFFDILNTSSKNK